MRPRTSLDFARGLPYASAMSWNQDTYKQVLDFAAQCHGSQRMEGSDMPYLVHLVKVCTEVLHAFEGDNGANVDLAFTCALLHDCVEDAGVTLETLRERFGAQVAAGVSALTKDESLPKAERMADSLRRITAQPKEIWAVKLGDRITNLESPPPAWSLEKRVAYRTEAELILRALGAGNPKLAARLETKIHEYAAFCSPEPGA